MVMGDLPEEAQLLVIGAGPAGYAAAFRAADLGLRVTLATDEEKLGGVCLLRGCIPSKTLLSLSDLIHAASESESKGIRFGKPEIDVQKLRAWKDGVVGKLTDGLEKLCDRRGVKLVRGRAQFTGSDSVQLDGGKGSITFRNAIVATGTRPTKLPGISLDDERILNSTTALDLVDIPENLCVVGGGYVGLELGQVYASLGSRVTLVEMEDRLLPAADPDLVEPLAKRLAGQFETIHLETRIAGIEPKQNGLAVQLAKGSHDDKHIFDRVLVSVGRKPNTDDIGLGNADVDTDELGFIAVDGQRRTSNPHIYAVGDAAGGLQLAHKAMHEGRVAAEAIAGRAAAFDVRAMPAVVYTYPQVAWCGLSEQTADQEGKKVKVAKFPWRASGRAQSIGAEDGITKLVIDPRSGRVLGMGAAGKGAEQLVAEAVLSIEMGATAEDLALTVHAHPTLSESLGEAAELYLGQALHLAP